MPQTWRELSGGGARDKHEIFKSRQLQSRSLCAIAFTSSSSPCCITHSHPSVRVNQRVMNARCRDDSIDDSLVQSPPSFLSFLLPCSSVTCREIEALYLFSHKISDMLKLSVTQGRHTSSHPPLDLSVSLPPSRVAARERTRTLFSSALPVKRN